MLQVPLAAFGKDALGIGSEREGWVHRDEWRRLDLLVSDIFSAPPAVLNFRKEKKFKKKKILSETGKKLWIEPAASLEPGSTL